MGNRIIKINRILMIDNDGDSTLADAFLRERRSLAANCLNARLRKTAPESQYRSFSKCCRLLRYSLKREFTRTPSWVEPRVGLSSLGGREFFYFVQFGLFEWEE